MQRLLSGAKRFRSRVIRIETSILGWWQPLMHKHEWDRMDEDEQRKVFRSDIVLGVGCAFVVYFGVKLLKGEL